MKEAIGLGGLKTITFTPSEPSNATPVQPEKVVTEKPKAVKPKKKPAKSAVDMNVTQING